LTRIRRGQTLEQLNFLISNYSKEVNFISSLIFVFLFPLFIQAEEDQKLSSDPSAPKPEVIPKALPVKPLNNNTNENRKALRALPLVLDDPESEEKPLRALPLNKEKEDGGKNGVTTDDDPESEEKPLRALPLNKEKEDGEKNGVTTDDDQGNKEDKEKEAPPKKFELPPLPPLNELDLANVDKKKSNIKAAWETKTEARTLTLKVPAPRGQITDRNGESLAQNKLGYFVSLKFPYLEDRSDENIINYANERIDFVSSLLRRDLSISDERILSHYKDRRWLPLPFSTILTDEEKQAFKKNPKPGLELFPTYQRYYPGHGIACHLIGYVGKKAKAPTGPVAPGELLWPITEGREGLEMTFDDHLQGSAGRINYLFDTNGAKLAEEMVARPVPGNNVVTSIDLEMQSLAEKSLESHTERGAFVVMDCHTGDIYAMASRPTYDINVWVPSISSKQFKALQQDPNLPLFPRAFRGQYPPASTFKIAVAFAALESGVVDQETLIECPKSLQIGDRIFRNWSKNKEGKLNIMNAIMRSCNTWFYVVGGYAGGDEIASMAHRFGFGAKTGIPLNAEEDGFIPTDIILREKYGHAFTGGYVAHASIGQGYVLATPLQVAQMMAGVGNGYVVPKPRLVLQVQDLNNNVTKSFDPEERNALNLDLKNLWLVRQGMVDVVNASAGTAKRARNDHVTMAGKTGTGQWVQNGENLLISWFAGFVPAENPRFAFAAICEGNPGEEISGSNKSAPMVGEFFNALYKLKNERGELKGYSKTAVASSFELPKPGDDQQAESNQSVRSESPFRRIFNPFRKKR